MQILASQNWHKRRNVSSWVVVAVLQTTSLTVGQSGRVNWHGRWKGQTRLSVMIVAKVSMVEQKCVGVMKWYIQMPMWDPGSLSLEAVSACSGQLSWQIEDHGRWRLKQLPGKDWLSTSHQKRRHKALKITQRDIFKRTRSYGLVWQSVLVFLCPSVSHTMEALIPCENKV